MKYALLMASLTAVIAGCNHASSASPANDRKVDVRIDAPGVKVDIQGQKKDP